MIQTSKKQKSKKIELKNFDTSGFTALEREEFKHLLAEAENRGLELPIERLDPRKIKFPKTPEGYYYKQSGKPFIPISDAQSGFIRSVGRYTLFAGSRGSGKSASGAQKALAKLEAGEPGMIMNPVFEDLRDSTWPEFRQWIPPDAVIPKDRYMLDSSWTPSRPFEIGFMNKASVKIKGLKNPKSGRGPNLNWLWYDEGGSDPTGMGWLTAIAAVRIGENPQAWVTSTPAGILHWMYEFFFSEEKTELIAKIFEEFGEELGERPMIETFHGTIEQNKSNLDAGYYASMKTAYQGWMEQQEIEGLFVAQGGALGNSHWFDGHKLNYIPDNIKIKNRVRFWDLAASEKKLSKKKTNDPDKTVGTLLSYARRRDNLEEIDLLPEYKGKDVFFIEDQVGGYWKYEDILTQIWDTAVRDGYYVKIRIEVEPGAGGINQVEAMKMWMREKCKEIGMPEFDFEGDRPEGDKIMRANVWFKEAREGMFYYIQGEWVQNFFRMLNSFPLHTHDDEIDSLSGARRCVAPIKLWKQIAFRSI